MDEATVKEILKHVPMDSFPKLVRKYEAGRKTEEWFVVGPNCLELWWQFHGVRFPRFMDPQVARILKN